MDFWEADPDAVAVGSTTAGEWGACPPAVTRICWGAGLSVLRFYGRELGFRVSSPRPPKPFWLRERPSHAYTGLRWRQ
jgi:hypothetical protein